MQREIYTPDMGPPQGPGPSREIYASMGGPAITQMLEDFYAQLGQSSIRHLFAPDEAGRLIAARKSALFFIFLLGGPPTYQETHGPPRMRARHLPFVIDAAGRQAWLDCFFGVLQDAPTRYGFPPEHLDGFKKFLEDFSAWMVNTQATPSTRSE